MSADLQGQVAELRRELDERAYEWAAKERTHNEEMDEMLRSMKDIMASRDKLKTRAEKLESTIEELRAAGTQHDQAGKALEKQVLSLKNSAASKSVEAALLSERVDELKVENERLEHARATAVEQREALQEEIKPKKDGMEEMELERTRLAARRDLSEADTARLNELNATLLLHPQGKNEKKVGHLARLKNENMDLRMQVRKLTEQLSRAKRDKKRGDEEMAMLRGAPSKENQNLTPRTMNVGLKRALKKRDMELERLKEGKTQALAALRDLSKGLGPALDFEAASSEELKPMVAKLVQAASSQLRPALKEQNV